MEKTVKEFVIEELKTYDINFSEWEMERILEEVKFEIELYGMEFNGTFIQEFRVRQIVDFNVSYIVDMR